MRPNRLPAFMLAAVAAAFLAAPTAAVTLTTVGPERVLFDQVADGCERWDIPDAPARAFRNVDGEIVLFAPNFRNRASIGPSLEGLTRDCAVRFVAGGKADPALLDDRSWLHAFWTEDGRNVFALASASFIPYRHGIACKAGSSRTDCWFNGIAALQSTDSGESFHYLGAPPGQIVFPPPEPYRDDVADPAGFLTATNIVEWKGALYTIVFRRGTGGDDPSRNCLARASRDDPLRWELWNGQAFVAASVFVGDKWHVITTNCARIGPPSLTAIRGLVFHQPSATFIAVFQYRTTRGSAAGQGFFYATSADLVSWSNPRPLYETELRPNATENGGAWAAYPSLIDETSSDRNFGTVGASAELLFVRFVPDPRRNTVIRALVAISLKID